MRLDDFRALVDGLLRTVPPEFQDGIVAIEVSPATVPDPVRAGVYTLGECVPLSWSGDGADLQSRIVLYHGSFAALARGAPRGFAWRREAWETLSHELRHHLEWRANVRALEEYDWAAEQNFARAAGQPFDPLFYQAGERLAQGVYKVEEDVFIEGDDRRRTEGGYTVTWHGRRYRVAVPPGVPRPLFVSLSGLATAPAGEAVLVFPGRPSLAALVRRPRVERRVVRAEALDG
jgi:hypothetical protein